MFLYVIRHGESLGNIRQSDSADCSLSPKGEKQAERVKQFLEERPITHIYSSPLTRTIETATPLALEKSLDIVLIPEMTEYFNENWTAYGTHPWLKCGDWVKDRAYCHFLESYKPEDQWWPHWPESRQQLTDRVNRFHQDVLSRHFGTDDEVVVFGHGASTSELRNIVYPSGDYPEIPGDTNAVIYQFALDESGHSPRCEVHYDHILDILSPPKNRLY